MNSKFLSTLFLCTSMSLTQQVSALSLNLFGSAIDKVSSIRHDSHVIETKNSRHTSQYAQTQYPLLLVHGFGLRFAHIRNEIAGMDQFYQIPPNLARNGASVFVAEFSIVESNSVRGE